MAEPDLRSKVEPVPRAVPMAALGGTGSGVAEAQRANRLLRSHAPLSYWLQTISVLAVGSLSLPILASFSSTGVTNEHRMIAILVFAAMLVVYPRLGIFRRLRNWFWGVSYITLAWTIVLALVAAGAAFIESSLPYTREFLAWAAGMAVFQAFLVGFTLWLFKLRANTGCAQVPVLVVGTGRSAAMLVDAISSNPFIPDTVVGMIREHSGETMHPSLARQLDSEMPVLGALDDIAQIVERVNVDRVYLALSLEKAAELGAIQSTLDYYNLDVIWLPDLTSLDLLNPTLREMSGLPLFAVSEGPLSTIGNAYLKSLFDVVFAVLCVGLCAPLMLLAAIGVKLSSRGPVFYRQRRVGWDGQVFNIWKFRSMVVHEEEGGRVTQAKVDDSRVTPFGRLLRRTSIDELPQLFNVLDGTMSMVGPRPHALIHNLDYADKITTYMARHRIKPGITGLAQVRGYRGETETVEQMRRRVEFDLQYINNWSIWRDLWLLIQTPVALLRSRNVY